jgi:Protein of unknown function (DUF2844)
MVQRSAKRILLFIAVGIVPWAAPVRASLGGNEASVLDDGVQLHGAVSSVTQQNYDTLEINAEAGTRVREYLGRDGVVFAVTWSGPAVPDLRQLLGTHFEEYTAALTRLDRPGLRRSVRVASPGLIVETDGHMRAYTGRARLPTLVPAGVSTDELR